jgi:hypothetical protein
MRQASDSRLIKNGTFEDSAGFQPALPLLRNGRFGSYAWNSQSTIAN